MLTITTINRLKPKEKLYRVLDDDGLYIEVAPTGKKHWRYRFRNRDGKYTMQSLGSYPSISLDSARALRDEKKLGMQFDNVLFKDVAASWLDWKNYSSESNVGVVQGRIDNYMNPYLGEMKLAEIKPADILKILKMIEAKGHLSLAQRIQQHLSGIFRYGIINLLCESNPADLVKGATKSPTVKNHPAQITQDGFQEILLKVSNGGLGRLPSLKFALELQPYVVLRSSEMRNIKLEDYKPAKRMIEIRKTKKHRELSVPLCDSAVRIVEAAAEMSDGVYLFSGMKFGSTISENGLNQRLRVYGIEQDQHVFHGYRSSFSTLAREVLKLNGDLIEVQLDHEIKDKVRGSYDKSKMLDDRIEMMQAWGEYVDWLKSGVKLLDPDAPDFLKQYFLEN